MNIFSKKRILLLTVLMTAMLCVIGCGKTPGIPVPDEPDFRRVHFGMTQEQVVESEQRNIPYSTTMAEIVFRNILVSEVSEFAELTYYFNEDGNLYEANYDFNPKSSTGVRAFDAEKCIELYARLAELFEEEYGEPDNTNDIAQVGGQDIIQSGSVYYSFERYSITMVFLSIDYAVEPISGVTVTYKSKTFS